MGKIREQHQHLPASGPAREALREKGQFWTPMWVAEAMVSYAVAGGATAVFDPAVGAGAFFGAAKKVGNDTDRQFKFLGREVDPAALVEAKQAGLSDEDLQHVVIRDFVLQPPSTPLSAIVANPPYIRHHRLSASLKAQLKNLSASIIGATLDGRAGFHVYFLLRALQLLAEDGRLAFIMPADTCEGVFAGTLWRWITARFKLDAVVTFAPEASPFPGVDTNAIVFLIRNTAPTHTFQWARCYAYNTPQLRAWLQSDLINIPTGDIVVHSRQISEGLKTGLSREPVNTEHDGPKLADFAHVVRGIATGANEFFFLTKSEAAKLGIPAGLLLPAVGRTRDIVSDTLTWEHLEALDVAGRPTQLISLDGSPLTAFPPQVQAYIKRGETLGVHQRALISTRHPWYKMEVREPPPFLFSYLGRRNVRFIRNYAKAMPLTGFLCVYPHSKDASYIEKLWEILKHPDTVANLARVGKSYGDGAIKVEPRALENLPLPASFVSDVGLTKRVSLKDHELLHQASFI